MGHTVLYPLLGDRFVSADFVALDLSPASTLLSGWSPGDQLQLGQRISDYVHSMGGCIGYGGYRERRQLYAASAHFSGGDTPRDIHLGVDFWGEVGVPVFAPMPGVVHSLAFNGAHLDYGATIILEHVINSAPFFTLYGHLSGADLEQLRPGERVGAGAVVGHIGPPADNGGWAPHLHFQCIRDMAGRRGDFPGVCTAAEEEDYADLCPDPMPWVIFEG